MLLCIQQTIIVLLDAHFLMDTSNCWSDMIALNNIVLLSPSLLYRCDIRFNLSPSVELRTLHRITPAEYFNNFPTVTVKPLLNNCAWLRFFIDADLSMRTKVLRTVAGCFALLCKLRSIRRSVPTSVYQTLVTAPVLSRVDYGNATLIGIRLFYVVISNLCSTPLLDLSLISGAQTTSLRRSPGFTSCARLCAYNSSWRCWFSNRCMDWLGSTWSTTLAAYSWHA